MPSNFTRAKEATLIETNVSESINASEVASVVLCFNVDGGEFWNMTMRFNVTSRLYYSIILGLPGNSNVTLFIRACDGAGNIASSSLYDYTVKNVFVTDINGDGKVDISDLARVSADFGKFINP